VTTGGHASQLPDPGKGLSQPWESGGRGLDGPEIQKDSVMEKQPEGQGDETRQQGRAE
jgi:hypothetical protein